VLKAGQRQFRVDLDGERPPVTAPHTRLPRFGGRTAKTFSVEAVTKVSDQLEHAPLCEVADLDNLLGFKGNYMLFPLFESNVLTDFMMEPYVDRATGALVDPADPAGWSLDEFSQYVCCLKGRLSEEDFARIRPDLQQQYETLLTSPRRNGDVLVVPTNSLFIEALPATHTLIEKYKQGHRLEDLKKAQADVREKELGNVLRAARLLAGQREDPHVDRRVVIEGGNGVVVPTDDH
jgi:hypothetical protein